MNCTIKKITAIIMMGALLLSGQSKFYQDFHGKKACASKKAESKVYKIMPLGDSITAGWCAGCKEHQFGGYRIYLGELLQENGYAEKVDFVGKWNSGECYDADNNGTNGACISYDYKYANSIQTDVERENIMEIYQPDIVLLQIGTNDINKQDKKNELLDINKIGDRLELLVDTIFSRLNENGVVFLASIPYMRGNSEKYNGDVDSYNDFIRDLVEKKSSDGKNIFFVDVNSVVKENQYDDDLHPNQDGYASMGRLWYETLSNYFENPIISSPSAEPSKDASVTPNVELQAGKKFVKQNHVLKITKLKKDKNGKVISAEAAYIKPVKSKAKIIIPDTVRFNNIPCKISSIQVNAFKNDKKLKQVTIGSYVKKIGAGAFKGDKNLKNVHIRSMNITQIGKNSFKGIAPNATIKIPKSHYKKYKRLFNSKTGYCKTIKLKKG